MYVAQCCNSKWCKVNGTSLGRMYYTRFCCLVQGTSIKYVRTFYYSFFIPPFADLALFWLYLMENFKVILDPLPFQIDYVIYVWPFSWSTLPKHLPCLENVRQHHVCHTTINQCLTPIPLPVVITLLEVSDLKFSITNKS